CPAGRVFENRRGGVSNKTSQTSGRQTREQTQKQVTGSRRALGRISSCPLIEINLVVIGNDQQGSAIDHLTNSQQSGIREHSAGRPSGFHGILTNSATSAQLQNVRNGLVCFVRLRGSRNCFLLKGEVPHRGRYLCQTTWSANPFSGAQ